jgi:hypothetical protein
MGKTDDAVDFNTWVDPTSPLLAMAGAPLKRMGEAMAEQIEHRGFRLEVVEFGAGWRVRIYTPSNKLMLEMPETDRSNGRTQVIRDAKSIVDRRIAILPTRALVPPPPMPRPGGRRRMFGRP